MERKPLVGLMPLWDDEKQSIWMLPGYEEGILAAGGIPVVLPLCEDAGVLEQLLPAFDGFLFTGGHDVNPEYYGSAADPASGPFCPARDAMEEQVFRYVLKTDTPLLGICRGIQEINVFSGGTLCQDLPDAALHHMKPPYDRTAHTVKVMKNTPLAELWGEGTFGVNSYHHQGIEKLGKGLAPMAAAEDGLIEGIYRTDQTFLLAIQWHPEFSFQSDPRELDLFAALVRAAKKTL